jgi:hypothetical protein
MSIIDDVFAPIYGKPCWSVQPGLGSSLQFNFGDPRLVIREPREPKSSASAEANRRRAHREVRVRGAWYLWISFCGWRFYNHDEEIGSSISSKDVINKVISEVDGQALVQVVVEEEGGTIFKFDLGGWLETYPVITLDDFRETMDCWTLFEPSGMAFTLRKDVRYLYKLGKAVSKEQDWLPLFPKTA